MRPTTAKPASDLEAAGERRRKALRKLLDKGMSYRAALVIASKRPADAEALEERTSVLR